MDWITGMQKAIDYIERNITLELDYEEIAKQSFSSSYHFQRVFSILCGYTLGEYIRNRRLTLAGAELASGHIKVIDTALKYGYESPDSFAKAFFKFHGITPSAAREPGATIRSFARLSIKISLEGGTVMDYRIEEKPGVIFTGYKKHFTGVPGERFDQEENFYVHTRANQYLLKGMAKDPVTEYCIMTDFDDDGYDFYIANILPDYMREHIEDDSVLGKEDAKRFINIEIPAHTYAVFETEPAKFPTLLHLPLRKQIITEWLPSSEYILSDAPEISVIHWYRKPNDEKRYIELWIPVEKKQN
jgi:AraC family transcriptional regulator